MSGRALLLPYLAFSNVKNFRSKLFLELWMLFVVSTTPVLRGTVHRKASFFTDYITLYQETKVRVKKPEFTCRDHFLPWQW